MVKFLKDNWFGMFMYGLFGAVMSMAGVSIVEKPVQALLLLGILIVVDVSSFMRGLSKGVL